MKKFQELGINNLLLKSIKNLGFDTPTEVQNKVIPILLKNESDIVTLAQTGTGKTAAFGFPILQKIDPSSKKTQGLILSPTRELCLQITQDIKSYSEFLKGLNIVAVYGGASITDQSKKIKKGAQIIVATPGRILDMIKRKIVNISKIEYCVLDEADEMLNMGFHEEIKNILSFTPKDKSTWLFSATMPKEVSSIAKKFMHNPVEVIIGSKNAGTKNVTHEYYVVNGRERYQTLKRLSDFNPLIFSVIFCRTKRDTQKVAENLIEDGYSAGALHGDLSQNQRDLIMKSFRNKQIQMLVATDVAARGIDVDNITHVINYQLPDEIETYTHRSGRTGRAGKIGVSIIIITQSELRKIKSIEKIIQNKILKKNIPNGEEICFVQLNHLAKKINNTKVNSEINSFIPEFKKEINHLTKDELIQKLVSVEFLRFHKYYKNSKDLNLSVSSSSPIELKSNKKNSIRFFMNIGKKDDFNWMTLKDFIKDNTKLSNDEIFHVDIMENFSFFNTYEKFKSKVISNLSEIKINDRKIKIEISKKPSKKNKSKNNFDKKRIKSKLSKKKSISKRKKSKYLGFGRKTKF
jgi:ATP-dependent RNA helicase DeaD